MYHSYQSKLDQLNSKLESLTVKLRQYPDEKLNAKPVPDAWSVLQVMQHLMTSEHLSLAYVKKKTSFQQSFKKAGLATKARWAALKISLWLPLKFKAPPAVNADNFPDKSDLKEIVQQWHENRKDLAQFLENVPKEWIGAEVYRHPRAGRLKLEEMLVFFDDHFVRHLKQIDRTLKQVAS